MRLVVAKAKYNTAEHKAARKAIDQAQAAGHSLTCVETVCKFKTWVILPNQVAVVAHNPAGTTIIGASHYRCNAHEAAVRGNKMRSGKRRRYAL